MCTIGSHIKGENIGIWGELETVTKEEMGRGERTTESGSKAGKSNEGISAKSKGSLGGDNEFEDTAADSNVDSGGRDTDSVDVINRCGGVTVYCRAEVQGGHQQ